jgi:hypothetical protein
MGRDQPGPIALQRPSAAVGVFRLACIFALLL